MKKSTLVYTFIFSLVAGVVLQFGYLFATSDSFLQEYQNKAKNFIYSSRLLDTSSHVSAELLALKWHNSALSEKQVVEQIKDILIQEERPYQVHLYSVNSGRFYPNIQSDSKDGHASRVLDCAQTTQCRNTYHIEEKSRYFVFNGLKGATNFRINTPIYVDEQLVAKLLIDMPLHAYLDAGFMLVEEFGRRMTHFIISDNNSTALTVHQEYPLSDDAVIQVRTSYVYMLTSHIGSILLTSILLFLAAISALLYKQTIQQRQAMNPRETFFDNNTGTYFSSVLKSDYFLDTVQEHEHNTLVYLQYDADKVKKEHGSEYIAIAFQHFVHVVNQFIRSTDFLIQVDGKQNQLMVVLPKCSIDNAKKVMAKMFYNFDREVFSDKNIVLNAAWTAAEFGQQQEFSQAIKEAKEQIRQSMKYN